METVLIVLAVLGAILIIVGRLMLWGLACHMSRMWVLAIRFLPLGDVVFLMRHWEIARNGGITSLVGLALTMPLIGMTLHNELHARQPQDPIELFGSELAGTRLQDAKPIEKKVAIQLKAEKIDALNNYLARWYESMEQRRQTLANATPEAREQYKRDAFAYQDLLTVSREEMAALEEMKSAP